jgi:hypothetical protein
LVSWKDSWVSKKVLMLTHCVLRETGQMSIFLLVQMHHTIWEQFTLFKQSSSWESCAGWPSSRKQKWYMDLSGSQAFFQASAQMPLRHM